MRAYVSEHMGGTGKELGLPAWHLAIMAHVRQARHSARAIAAGAAALRWCGTCLFTADGLVTAMPWDECSHAMRACRGYCMGVSEGFE